MSGCSNHSATHPPTTKHNSTERQDSASKTHKYCIIWNMLSVKKNEANLSTSNVFMSWCHIRTSNKLFGDLSLSLTSYLFYLLSLARLFSLSIFLCKFLITTETTKTTLTKLRKSVKKFLTNIYMQQDVPYNTELLLYIHTTLHTSLQPNRRHTHNPSLLFE